MCTVRLAAWPMECDRTHFYRCFELLLTDAYLGIADVLDIDWASLVQDTSKSRPQKAKSVLKYYSPAAVLARLGVSRKYAGDGLFEELRAKCCQQQREDEEGTAINLCGKPYSPKNWVRVASMEIYDTKSNR